MNHWVGFLSVGLFSLLIGLGSRGEAQYALYVPWAKVNALMAKEPAISESRSWPELQFQAGEFPIKFSQSSLQVTGKLALTAETLGNISFTAQDLKVELQSDQLIAKGVIRRQVGSVIVNAELNAQCRGLHAQVLSGLQARGVIHLQKGNEGLFTASLVGLQLSSSSLNWQLTVEGCDGAQGIETLLQKEIEKILQQPQGFAAEIQKALVAPLQKLTVDLQNKLNTQIQTLLQSHDLPRVTQLEINEDGGDGFWLVAHNGQPLTHFPKPKPDFFSLILPRSVIEGKLIESFSKTQLRTERSLNQETSLKKLLGSRFLQFFIFPDLMSFKKNTEFVFKSLQETIQTAQSSSTSLAKASTPELQVTALVQGAVFAKESQSQSPIEFLAANVSTQGWLRWQVLRNELTWQWQAKASHVKVGFSARTPAKHRRYGRMPVSQMQSAIQNLIQKREGVVQLPKFSLSETANSVVHAVEIGEEEVRVDFLVGE